MPTVRINGVDVEVPRHVHRADGKSKIVWTEEAYAAACADGWHPVPPSADAPVAEVPTVTPEPVASVAPAPEPPVEPVVDIVEVIADAVRAEEIPPPEPEPVAPVSRPRGRPRKVQP